MAPEDMYIFTFTTPGVYSYYCTLHPFMTGQKTVGEPIPSDQYPLNPEEDLRSFDSPLNDDTNDLAAAFLSGGLYNLTGGTGDRFVNGSKEITPNSTSVNSEDFIDYENKHFGFKIRYPSNWNVYEDFRGISFGTPSNVSLFIQKSPMNNITFAKIIEQKIEGIRDSSYGPLEIIDSIPIELGGKPAYRVIICCYFAKTWTYTNNTFYSLDYVASNPDYSLYLPTINKMLKSFKIIPFIQTTESNQWNKYNSSLFEYSLEYPTSWNFFERENRFLKQSDTIFIPQSNSWMKDTTLTIYYDIIKNKENIFNYFRNSTNEDSLILATSSYKVPYTKLNEEVDKLLDSIENSNLADVNFRILDFVDYEKYKIDDQETATITMVMESIHEYDPIVVHEIVMTKHNNKFYSFYFGGSSDNFDESNISKLREHIFNSIQFISHNENNNIETINNQEPLDPEMFLNKLLSPSAVNASALGNEKANITIVEFADYQCPFCAQFNKETKNSIIKNFVDTGKLSFYIRISL